MAKKEKKVTDVEAAEAEAKLSASLKEWEAKGPDNRTGTSCKCGAHASVIWEKGGREWLTAHIAEAHPTAFDWPAAIKKALAMPDALDALAFLETLLPAEEEKGSLADA